MPMSSFRRASLAGEGGVLVVDCGVAHQHCFEVVRIVFEEVAGLKVVEVLLRLHGGVLAVDWRIISSIIAAVVWCRHIACNCLSTKKMADAANDSNARECSVVIDIYRTVAAKTKNFACLDADFVAETVKKVDGLLLDKLLKIG